MNVEFRPIAVTMGEPAGIGGEITLKAWRTREASGLPPYFVVDDAARLRRIAAQLEWDIPVVEIEKPEDAVDAFGNALPVVPLEVPRRLFLDALNPRPRRLSFLQLSVLLNMSKAARRRRSSPIPFRRKHSMIVDLDIQAIRNSWRRWRMAPPIL